MRLILLYLFLWGCSVSNTEAQTVYTTKTGSKYHREDCRYLSHSKYPVALDKAQSRGYEACKVCKPPTTVTDKNPVIDKTKTVDPPKPERTAVASQCTATAKSTGNRCKRMTKNASGRCWQHE